MYKPQDEIRSMDKIKRIALSPMKLNISEIMAHLKFLDRMPIIACILKSFSEKRGFSLSSGWIVLLSLGSWSLLTLT